MLQKIVECCYDFKSYKNVYLERCYFVYDMNDHIELVHLRRFSDASTLAYSACIYIKSVSKAGNIKISLVTSKSRLVAFRKKFSTPRLELLGILFYLNLSMLFTMLCCRRLLFSLIIVG